VKRVFSKLGAIVWLIVITATIFMLAPHWGELREATRTLMLDFKNNYTNLAALYLTFVFIKLIHELGHAFACRRFGGEVHELGLMFLVFVPTPYVDASTAWAFPSRWQRIFVGAAGMIVELFFACICAFIWLNTHNGDLIRGIAYNAMLIASVSTLIFNANPLLRYDGYYILSDWLEIPNLRQKSVEYSLGLIKRHIFRIKLPNPLPPVGQRIWLLLYAVASGCYRIFVGVMIVVIVAFKVPVLGVLMAIGGVITWLGVPLYKVTKYILLEPELERKRGRAAVFASVVAALLIIAIGVVRVPRRFTAMGVLEPSQQAVLHVDEPGFVSQIAVVDGQLVHGPVRDASGKITRPGDVILVLDDEELDTKFKKDQENLELALTSEARDLPTDVNKYNQDLANERQCRQELAQDHQRLDSQTIRAPIDGTVVSPNLDKLSGVFLPPGQEVAVVANTSDLLIKVDVDQRNAELPFYASSNNSLTVEYRVAGAPSDSHLVPPHNITLLPEANDQLASASLGINAGGTAPPDPKDQTGTKTSVPQFEVRLDVPNNKSPEFETGQRATVRFTIDRQPLIVQWYTQFLQLLNTQDTGKWI
jgi:putative peptide zinc metalloprotease protein